MEAPEIHPGRRFVLADGDPSPELMALTTKTTGVMMIVVVVAKKTVATVTVVTDAAAVVAATAARRLSFRSAADHRSAPSSSAAIVTRKVRDHGGKSGPRTLGGRTDGWMSQSRYPQFCSYRYIFNKTDTVEGKIKTKLKKETNVMITKRKTAAKRL